MLKRDDINCCLFFLLLFTGIGWIIYLVIWLLTPEDKCMICGRKTLPARPEIPATIQSQEEPTSIPEQVSAHETYKMPQVTKDTLNSSAQTIKKVEARFCPFCGHEVPVGGKFCANCGSEI
jgi:hypothetical protein